MYSRALYRFGSLLLMLGSSILAFGEPGKFAVGGNATLMVQPDYVTVQVTVRSSAALATEASEEVSDTTKKLLDVVRDSGVLQADVTTTGIMISENRMRGEDCADLGLTAYLSLSLVLRDLETVEETIDQLIKGGGWVQQVRPGIKDVEDHQNRALQIAIDDARASADAAAKQLDLELGDAIEVSFASPGQTQAYNSAKAIGGGGFSSSNTYLPGLIPISQSVQIVFTTDAGRQ